jgi:hypothetical protein
LLDSEQAKSNIGRYWLKRKPYPANEVIAKILLKNRVGIFFDVRDPSKLFDYTEVEYFATIGANEAVKLLLEPFIHKQNYKDIRRPPLNKCPGGEDSGHWLRYFSKHIIIDQNLEHTKKATYVESRYFGFPWHAFNGIFINYTDKKFPLLVWLLDNFSIETLRTNCPDLQGPILNLYYSKLSVKYLIKVFELLIPLLQFCEADLFYTCDLIIKSSDRNWVPIFILLCRASFRGNFDPVKIEWMISKITNETGLEINILDVLSYLFKFPLSIQ